MSKTKSGVGLRTELVCESAKFILGLFSGPLWLWTSFILTENKRLIKLEGFKVEIGCSITISIDSSSNVSSTEFVLFEAPAAKSVKESSGLGPPGDELKQSPHNAKIPVKLIINELKFKKKLKKNI